MREAQMAYHHQRGSVCNRAPSSRTRLDCDRRAPLERLARPLLRSLRQTARHFFHSLSVLYPGCPNVLRNIHRSTDNRGLRYIHIHTELKVYGVTLIGG